MTLSWVGGSLGESLAILPIVRSSLVLSDRGVSGLPRNYVYGAGCEGTSAAA